MTSNLNPDEGHAKHLDRPRTSRTERKRAAGLIPVSIDLTPEMAASIAKLCPGMTQRAAVIHLLASAADVQFTSPLKRGRPRKHQEHTNRHERRRAAATANPDMELQAPTPAWNPPSIGPWLRSSLFEELKAAIQERRDAVVTVKPRLDGRYELHWSPALKNLHGLVPMLRRNGEGNREKQPSFEWSGEYWNVGPKTLQKMRVSLAQLNIPCHEPRDIATAKPNLFNLIRPSLICIGKDLFQLRVQVDIAGLTALADEHSVLIAGLADKLHTLFYRLGGGYQQASERDSAVTTVFSCLFRRATLIEHAGPISENAAEHSVKLTLIREPLAARQAYLADPIQALLSDDELDVMVTGSLWNPRHLSLANPKLSNKDIWSGPVALDNSVWSEFLPIMERQGTRVETTRPAPFSIPDDLLDNIPGWISPAANGYRLLQHQREAVEFILQRFGFSIIGDEMGLGKSATAIAATCALGAKRTVVVAPSSARGVWGKEIRGWAQIGHAPTIAIATDSLGSDMELPTQGWALVTYDQLTPRDESIDFKLTDPSLHLLEQFLQNDVILRAAIKKTDGAVALTDIKATELNPETGHEELVITGKRLIIRGCGDVRVFNALRKHLHLLDNLSMEDRIGRAMDRATGVLLQRLLEWEPDLVIVDEAHRIKNPESSRTKIVRTLIARGRGQAEGQAADVIPMPHPSRQTLLLTGTPLRNNAAEGRHILDAVFPGQVNWMTPRAKRSLPAWSHKTAVTEEVVKRLFARNMIRRLKADVLPNLPPKMRHTISVSYDALDHERLAGYMEAMDMANQQFAEGYARGGEAEARKAARPSWSRARSYLGQAKVNAAFELVQEVLEEKPALLLFVHHKPVVKALESKLKEAEISFGVITGDTKTADRTSLEAKFQAGNLQVLILSIQAAGEALTLTRADTVVFAELAWVPTELMQAEDRGHRTGQTAQSYTIHHLVADMPTSINIDAIMADVLLDKVKAINRTLGEDMSVLGEDAGGLEENAFQRLSRITKDVLIERGELREPPVHK